MWLSQFKSPAGEDWSWFASATPQYPLPNRTPERADVSDEFVEPGVSADSQHFGHYAINSLAISAEL
jgi:hypothetical protein